MASRSEGRDVAIDAAKRRLAAAKKLEASVTESLDAIKNSLKAAKGEVEEAESFLKETYEKYEVIDVDDDDSASKAAAAGGGGNKGVRKREVSLSPDPETQGEKRARTSASASAPATRAPSARSTSSNGTAAASRGGNGDGIVDEITVEGAGSAKVNGVYKLRQSRDGLPGTVDYLVDQQCQVFSKSGSWQGEAVEYIIYKSGSCNGWRLRLVGQIMGSVLYYYNYQEQTLPPKSGWSASFNGKNPAPQLEW